MATELERSDAVDPRELLSAVRMLGAAWPRASWKRDSEAVYVMALTQEGVPAVVARKAIAGLITTEMELPPVALVLRRCREVASGEEFYEWKCPECWSDQVAGSRGGPGLCFDCDWEGVFPW